LSLLISGNISEGEAVVEHALRIDPRDRVTPTLAIFIASVKAQRIFRTPSLAARNRA
jgi:hypothetical protein